MRLDAILRLDAQNATMIKPPPAMGTHVAHGGTDKRSAETQTVYGLRNPWPS
jgi:hypothetical protein